MSPASELCVDIMPEFFEQFLRKRFVCTGPDKDLAINLTIHDPGFKPKAHEVRLVSDRFEMVLLTTNYASKLHAAKIKI